MTDSTGAHPIDGMLHTADGTTTRIQTAPGTGKPGDVIRTQDETLVWDGEGWESHPVSEADALIAARQNQP